VGGACEAPITLVGAATDELSPAVACAGDDVIVMWEDYRSGNSDLAYRRSSDGGDSFLGLQFLVQGPSQETNPALVMSGDVALVVWEDDRNGKQDLAARRSGDRGATWGNLTFLVASSFDDTDPVLDLDGNNALLVWVDRRSGNQDLAYRRSTDSGMSFLGLNFLVKAATDDKEPVVSVNGDEMMIAWVDTRSGNDDLAYRRSINAGVSFAGLTFLVKAPTDDSELVIVASGTDGLLVWVDERSGNRNISYRRSDDGGQSFLSTVRLVSADTDDFAPACALEGGLAVCGWTDTRTGEPVPNVRNSVDGGQTWLPRQELD
jgi:hypothetical protein